MARYEVRFKKSVEKDLWNLPQKDVQAILLRVEELRTESRPSGCKKLGNNLYRLRQGMYRIIYEVHDKELVIIDVKIGHRPSVYQFIN